MEASISWLKTDFEASKLSVKNAPEAVYSNNETTITVYVEEHSSLDTVLLNYTSNDWSTSTTLEMTASQNQTYVGTIPGQPAGATVKYRILAFDEAGNKAEAQDSYVVKNPTNLKCSLSKPVIQYGENITVTGCMNSFLHF